MDICEILEHISHKLPAQGPIKDFIHHNTLHAFQHLPFHEALAEAGAFYGAASYMPPWFYGQSDLPALASTNPGEGRESLDLAIAPILIRLTSGFLDQGIAISPFPESDSGFFEALRKLTNNSFVPIAYYVNKKRSRAWFEKSPVQVCEEILKQLVGQKELYEQYITETLMAHRGWAGMVNAIEKRPTSLLVPRSIKLVEFLALKLILESEYIKYTGNPLLPSLKLRQASPNEGLRDLHEAYENAYYKEILAKFKNLTPAKQEKPNIQAVFCIDDRECSFRRHLEQADPKIETFATAGFFGIDFYFQSINDASPKKLCPAPVQPKHLVFEKPRAEHQTEFEIQKKQIKKNALGLAAWLGFIANSKLKIDVQTELELYREDELVNQDTKLFHGFSYDEMAQRVFSVLNSMGLTHDFAPLVTLIAHGSNSLNNPHFAAYDCGACSGNPGAPNARAFATMANLGPVRERLHKLGISIPSHTRFIGGFHDTCTESVDFFDTENLKPEQQAIFSNFLDTLETAKKHNAKERCTRFALIDRDITPEEALTEVQHRASVLFEPRPELGHANNALCIVGRRQLTKNLFFDRRAFLNSYDQTQDPNGQILNQILSAVIPVCGGINLEYYFSRIDNAVYGCGTKLSHNVCSLLGVYNGIDDDLRTGLPIQMIEIHEPIRLLIIIEQEPEIVYTVIQNNKPVFEWIENEWVKLACISPKSHAITFYKPIRGFVNDTSDACYT